MAAEQAKLEKKILKLMASARQLVLDNKEQLAQVPELQKAVREDMDAQAFSIIAQAVAQSWASKDRDAAAKKKLLDAVALKDEKTATVALRDYFKGLKVDAV